MTLPKHELHQLGKNARIANFAPDHDSIYVTTGAEGNQVTVLVYRDKDTGDVKVRCRDYANNVETTDTLGKEQFVIGPICEGQDDA